MDPAPEIRWRVGTVPYLVAKPLTHGLAEDPRISMIEAPPSTLASMLHAGQLDIALASSVLLFDDPPLQIWDSGPVIACNGPIHSVLLFLAPGVENHSDLRTWIADPHSHTGRRLTEWLMRFAWHNPSCRGRAIPSETDPFAFALEHGIDAVQLIGDPALEARRTHPEWRIVDLGSAWKSATDQPFVFAGWMSAPGFRLGKLAQALENAATRGLAGREQLALTAAGVDVSQAAFLRRYLLEDTLYRLTEQEIQNWSRLFTCQNADDTVLGA